MSIKLDLTQPERQARYNKRNEELGIGFVKVTVPEEASDVVKMNAKSWRDQLKAGKEMTEFKGIKRYKGKKVTPLVRVPMSKAQELKDACAVIRSMSA